MKIYHNPRCRKSRETLGLIKDAGIEPELVLYLENPPKAAEIRKISEMLGMPPSAFVRKGEPIFKEHFKEKTLSEEEWIEAMVEYPKLIERPIVVKGNKAIIGRPPENVQTLL